MKIQVAGLSDGIHEYRFEAAPSELHLGEELSRIVNVVATLDKTGTQIFLTARLETVGNFTCDRCVTQFDTLLSASYQMYYVWEGTDVSRFDPAEIQVISSGLNVIDLSEDVRQTLLLSVPLKLLCRDTCKGLCPRCGRNLNEGSCNHADPHIDSRWEKLQILQKNNTKDLR